MKFVSVFQFWGFSLVIPLWVCLWTFHSSRSYCLTSGEKKKKKRIYKKKSLLMTLNQPSEFCWSSWMPQAEGAWALLFSLPMVMRGWGTGLCRIVHSCPASNLLPPCAGPPLPVCARPVPSIHQFCCPWGAPVRGNSHPTFVLCCPRCYALSKSPQGDSDPPVPATELSLSGDH